MTPLAVEALTVAYNGRPALSGVTWAAVPGDRVRAGQVVLTLHTDDEDRIPAALADLAGGWQVRLDGTDVERLPLVIEQIG